MHTYADRTALTLMTGCTLLLGCGGNDAAPVEFPIARFAIAGGTLSGPDTLEAGVTTVHLEVADGSLDHVSLVRLEEGHTVAEFLAATEVAYPPFWAYFSGGPNGVTSGGEGEVMMELATGDWLALAFDIGPEGFPRVRHQLSKPFTVVAKPRGAALPEAQVQLALFDYGFLLSAPLVAGTSVIEVANLSPQRHEVILVELPAGENADAMAAWLLARRGGEPVGTPSGRVVGGVAALTQSQRNFWTVTLPAGNYAFLCLLADDGSGKPHLEHGHLQRFEVLEAADLIRTDSL